jgi:ribosomal protein S27AE
MASTDDNQDPNDLYKVVMEKGAVVVERFDCEQCGTAMVQAHSWVEVTTCGNCGHRLASKVPGLPLPGELRLDHLKTAVETLAEAYQGELIAPGLGAPTAKEIQALPTKVQLLLYRQSLATARQTLVKALALAEQLAAIGTEDEYERDTDDSGSENSGG